MNLEEFIKHTSSNLNEEKVVCRRIISCNDGTAISIQAGFRYLSTPDFNTDNYTHFEIISTSNDELLVPYKALALECSFVRVPYDIVQKFLDSHGGISLYHTLESSDCLNSYDDLLDYYLDKFLYEFNSGFSKVEAMETIKKLVDLQK